jgi:hypothetical protein
VIARPTRDFLRACHRLSDAFLGELVRHMLRIADTERTPCRPIPRGSSVLSGKGTTSASRLCCGAPTIRTACLMPPQGPKKTVQDAPAPANTEFPVGERTAAPGPRSTAERLIPPRTS